MWMLHARYCPMCSTQLAEAEVFGRTRLRCGECSFVLFANPVGAAGAVVIDEHKRVLLVKRAIQPHRGCWTLPAGYQEIDESPQQAAEREILEETGVTIRVAGLLDIVFVPDDPRKPANLALFLGVPLEGEARGLDDASDAAWFDLEELPDDYAFAASWSVMQRLRESTDEAAHWWRIWERARPPDS